MADMHQEVYIKWGFGTPRLKGRLRPIIAVPKRKPIKPVVEENLPLYIDPEPLKPIILRAVEPPLAEPIQPVIPDYIGDLDERPTQIHKEPFDDAPADKDRETPADVKATPLKL